MLRQIFGPPRSAAQTQILRAGAEHLPDFAHPPGLQRGVSQCPDPHAQIHALFAERDGAIQQQEPRADLRPPPEVLPDDRRDMALPEEHRRRDRHRAARGRLTFPRLQLLEVGQQLPATLQGLAGLNGATASGTLKAATREAIALVVAEANGCDYCLSAHTVLGRGAGMTDEDIDRARDGAARDPKTAAILKLARSVVTDHGRIPVEGLAAARQGGLSDAEILETVSNVVLNIFTNYINLVADTEIDFPVVTAGR